MSGAHAFLPPSSAAAWVVCGAWPWMNQKYPQADTPVAMEGTAAHWGFEELFAGRDIAEGLVAPNGITLTEEMCEGADLYVETIDNALRVAHLDRNHLQIERRVAIPYVSEYNDGTPDTWFYDHAGRTLHLFDYKFGHDFVEVFGNWQLVDYTCGILESLGIDGAADQATRVIFYIVQPRSYHRDGPVRRWPVMASDLRARFNLLQSAAERAVKAPSAQVGDQCEHCPGRHACEALQASAYQAADKAGVVTPLELSPLALGIEARMLKRAARRLEARISGLEANIDAQLRAGQQVPHFRMEPTAGRESYIDGAYKTVLMIGMMYKKDLAKPALVTPNQARKLGIPAEVLAPYLNPAKSGVKLAEDNGSAAAKAFSPGI